MKKSSSEFHPAPSDSSAARRMGETHSVVANVENYKRRRARPHFANDLLFFNRVLAMKKLEDCVFISKTAAKNR